VSSIRIGLPHIRIDLASPAEVGFATAGNGSRSVAATTPLPRPEPRGMTRPIGVKPECSKADRMAAQSAKIEAGHVHLPNCAPWLGEFLMVDDQVDSVSQFLRWWQNDAYQNPVLCPPILITRADMGLPPHIDWSCRH
jgi:hypothetical protein